jgi:hypothetical protein
MRAKSSLSRHCCERRDLILTRDAHTRAQGVGMVKSLELIGSGPVGLTRTQNLGIKSEKPLKARSQRWISHGPRRFLVKLAHERLDCGQLAFWNRWDSVLHGSC